MGRRYLIAADDLKDQGMISNNVEDVNLSAVLWRCQEMTIQPIIGTALYNKLLDYVQAFEESNTAIPADYKTLLEDYVIPCLIPYVEMKFIPHANYKIKSKAVGSSGDDIITPSTKQETVNLQDAIAVDAAHFRERLITFIRVNLDKYQEYLERNWGDLFPENRQSSVEDQMLFISGGIGCGCRRDERGYKVGDT